MAKIDISRMASDVATLLGESLARECLPEDSPFPDLEDRVKILAPEILARLILEAPHEASAEFKTFPDTPIAGPDGVTILSVPEDFLRLESLKMSDWEREVTVLSAPGSPEAALQSSRWTGIRGNKSKPAAIMGYSAGKKVVRLFSSSPEARLETALYIPYPAIDTRNQIAVPPLLYFPLVEEISRKISGAQG